MVEIPVEIEQRLRQEAARMGLAPDEFIRRVLSTHLGAAPSPARSVSDLVRQWAEEDPPTDAGDVAAREAEFEQFKVGMNRNRIESDGPDARKPYP